MRSDKKENWENIYVQNITNVCFYSTSEENFQWEMCKTKKNPDCSNQHCESEMFMWNQCVIFCSESTKPSLSPSQTNQWQHEWQFHQAIQVGRSLSKTVFFYNQSL